MGHHGTFWALGGAFARAQARAFGWARARGQRRGMPDAGTGMRGALDLEMRNIAQHRATFGDAAKDMGDGVGFCNLEGA